MSYGRYTLKDGREAGYAVTATCDQDGCDEQINRGFDFLCGDMPGDGVTGCGNYYCNVHSWLHDCEIRDEHIERMDADRTFRTCIIAPTRTAARDWLRHHALLGVRYLGSSDGAMGIDRRTIVLVHPSAGQHREYDAIMEVLLVGGARIVELPTDA